MERKTTQTDEGVTYGNYTWHSNNPTNQPINQNDLFLAPLISPGHFRIDFSSQTAEDVYNKYRALDGLGKLSAAWKQSGKR